MCDIPEFIVTHGFPQSSYNKNGRPYLPGTHFTEFSCLLNPPAPYTSHNTDFYLFEEAVE